MIILAVVFLAALAPAMWFAPRETLRVLFGVDKWLHALAFLFLAVWFSGQYARRSYWRIAVGLLAFGMMIELCQRLVTYRTGDMADLAANAAGIAAGLLVAAAGVGGWSLRVVSWLTERSQQA